MVKLHLGCGWRDFGSDWIHIDGGDYSHLQGHNIVDLSQFEDNSVDVIYASHVLEYFDRAKVLNVLLEWRRVLKLGGLLRIAVPDFTKLVEVYQKTGDLDKILGPLFGKMVMSDDYIYHKTVYDFSSLEKVLESVGFSDTKPYDWTKTDHAHFDDHSQAYYPHMDKEHGILISLNVEAIKC